MTHITHEEAYKAHCNAIIGQTADEVDKNHDIVKRYMKQQAKAEELLGLYRECNKEGVFWLEIQQRIAQLEKELEELK